MEARRHDTKRHYEQRRSSDDADEVAARRKDVAHSAGLRNRGEVLIEGGFGKGHEKPPEVWGSKRSARFSLGASAANWTSGS